METARKRCFFYSPVPTPSLLERWDRGIKTEVLRTLPHFAFQHARRRREGTRRGSATQSILSITCFILPCRRRQGTRRGSATQSLLFRIINGLNSYIPLTAHMHPYRSLSARYSFQACVNTEYHRIIVPHIVTCLYPIVPVYRPILDRLFWQITNAQ